MPGPTLSYLQGLTPLDTPPDQGNGGVAPVLGGLPNNLQQFNKDATFLANQPDVPPSIGGALSLYNRNKLAGGSSPLSLAEMQGSLKTLQTGVPFTPQPAINPWNVIGNAGNDLTSILRAVPRLPWMLLDEAHQIPHFGDVYQQELAATGNPIAALAKSPGFNLIPGSYTLGNIASGHPMELVAHPLQTALDLLPLAHGYIHAPTGLLDEAGNPLTNADTLKATNVGQAYQAAKESLASSKLGQAMSERFGTQARELSRMENDFSTQVKHLVDPNSTLPDPITNDLARQSHQLRMEYSDMEPEQRRQVFEALQLGDPGGLNIDRDPRLPQLQQLDGRQLSAYNAVADLTEQYRQLNTDSLGSFQGEVFDPKTAGALQASLDNLNHAQTINSIRNDIFNVQEPTVANPDIGAAIDRAKTYLDNPAFKTAQQQQVLAGTEHLLAGAGYPTSVLHELIRDLPVKAVPDATADAIKSELDRVASRPPPITSAPPMSQVQILDALKDRAKVDPQVGRLFQSVQHGDYSGALDRAGVVASRTGPAQVPDIDTIRASLQRLAPEDKYLASTADYTDKRVAKMSETHMATVAKTPPARFQGLIEQKIQNGLLDKYSLNPDFPTISQAIIDKNYGYLSRVDPDFNYRTYADEAAKTWQDMRDAGANPIFIHHVTPNAQYQLNNPSVIEHATIPGQFKARDPLDITPFVRDPFVALDHMGLEIIQSKMNAEFGKAVLDTWGKTGDELATKYEAKIKRMMDLNPVMDYPTAASTVIGRDMVPFNPESFGVSRSSIGSPDALSDTYIPKSVAANLRRLHTPTSNMLKATLDPIMKVYRLSASGLSPRILMHSTLGNMFLAGAEDPRILTRLADGFRMAHEGGAWLSTGERIELPEVLKGGTDMLPEELAKFQHTGTLPPDNVAAQWIYQFKAGQFARELYDASSTARNAVMGLSDRIYGFTSMAHDMYNSAAFLQGAEDAIARGESGAALTDAGLQTARRVVAHFDDLTPFEREIMRYVFPFYGYTSFLMKYVMRYPFDHPLRASIMSSLVRNELADHKSFGTDFLNSIALGVPDAQGFVKDLDLSAISPFSHVSNYFTLSGFTGATNPLVKTFLEQMGVNTSKGTSSLYPTAAYDPSTGELTTSTPNFFSNLLGNTIPQSQILTGMVDGNSRFRQLLTSDPHAAMELIRSQAGIPVIFSQINPYIDQIKGEVGRERLAQSKLKSAEMSGDYSDFLNTYPMYAGQVNALEGAIQGGSFFQYQLDAHPELQRQAQDLIPTIYDAFIRSNIPLAMPQSGVQFNTSGVSGDPHLPGTYNQQVGVLGAQPGTLQPNSMQSR